MAVACVSGLLRQGRARDKRLLELGKPGAIPFQLRSHDSALARTSPFQHLKTHKLFVAPPLNGVQPVIVAVWYSARVLATRGFTSFLRRDREAQTFGVTKEAPCEAEGVQFGARRSANSDYDEEHCLKYRDRQGPGSLARTVCDLDCIATPAIPVVDKMVN
jgi:hypothetical protein